ncbi:MAG: hypothetical protein RSC68_28865, partial [Acinetobacter sp.]
TGSRAKTQVSEINMIGQQIQAIRDGRILDRFTPISAMCYNCANSNFQQQLYNTVIHWAIQNAIIIHCSPPDEVCKNFSTHEVREGEDPNHEKWLIENADRILDNYKALFYKVPHIKYDYTEKREFFADNLHDYYNVVKDNFSE